MAEARADAGRSDGAASQPPGDTGRDAVSDDDSFLRLAAHIPVSDPDRSGQRLGHFQLQRRLGRGGMGAVYAALDVRLSRRVAVKVLRARAACEVDPRRLLREARAAAAVEHPSIVTVFDVGVEGDALYIAMELVEGETLRERLSQGPLPRREAARLVQRVAEAVGLAHAAGIVHRDLKPENIMLTPQGDLKLLDFGLAGADEELPSPGATADLPTVGTATRLAGTPGYMAPEQCRGERVTPATDVWALGVVLHELVTGERPRAGAPVDALGGRLGRIVQACLAESPAARPSTGGALAAALERARARERLAVRGVLLGGVLVSGAGAAWLAFSAPASPGGAARPVGPAAGGVVAMTPEIRGVQGAMPTPSAAGAPPAGWAPAVGGRLAPPASVGSAGAGGQPVSLATTASAMPAAAGRSSTPRKVGSAVPPPPVIDPLARQR